MPTPFEGIEELAAIHWKRRTWQDKPDWYWFFSLLEEVIELGLSLLGLHRHTPESEMCQIASICENWIKRRRAGLDGNSTRSLHQKRKDADYGLGFIDTDTHHSHPAIGALRHSIRASGDLDLERNRHDQESTKTSQKATWGKEAHKRWAKAKGRSQYGKSSEQTGQKVAWLREEMMTMAYSGLMSGRVSRGRSISWMEAQGIKTKLARLARRIRQPISKASRRHARPKHTRRRNYSGRQYCRKRRR